MDLRRITSGELRRAWDDVFSYRRVAWATLIRITLDQQTGWSWTFEDTDSAERFRSPSQAAAHFEDWQNEAPMEQPENQAGHGRPEGTPAVALALALPSARFNLYGGFPWRRI